MGLRTAGATSTHFWGKRRTRVFWGPVQRASRAGKPGPPGVGGISAWGGARGWRAEASPERGGAGSSTPPFSASPTLRPPTEHQDVCLGPRGLRRDPGQVASAADHRAPISEAGGGLAPEGLWPLLCLVSCLPIQAPTGPLGQSCSQPCPQPPRAHGGLGGSAALVRKLGGGG